MGPRKEYDLENAIEEMLGQFAYEKIKMSVAEVERKLEGMTRPEYKADPEYAPYRDRSGEEVKYTEILQLYFMCRKIGIDARLEYMIDGFAIRFPSGGAFVQHYGSYGTDRGCVEPAIGCELDYTAVELKTAKRLVARHKEHLNTPRKKREVAE